MSVGIGSDLTFEELLQARKKDCAITGMRLAIAERIVALGGGLYANADAVSDQDLRQFASDLRRRRELQEEINDLGIRIWSLEKEQCDAQLELRNLERSLGLEL